MTTAKSQRELAKAVGKSQPAILKWIRDDRWPFSKTGPWDVAQVQAWASRTHGPNAPATPPLAASRQTTPRPTNADPVADLTPERQAKLALSLEKLETAKLANQLRRGEVHSIQECQSRRVRQVLELRNELLSIADTVGQQLGLDTDQREILRGHLLGLCRKFAGQNPAGEPTGPSKKN